jgi:hypothetical protein
MHLFEHLVIDAPRISNNGWGESRLRLVPNRSGPVIMDDPVTDRLRGRGLLKSAGAQIMQTTTGGS